MATYEVWIRNGTDGKSSSPLAGSSAEGQSTGGGLINPNSNAGKALKGVLAVKSAVAPFVNQVVTHKISTVSLSTGASEQQERLAFAYSIGQQVGNAALSIAAGAAFGGLPGAVIGLVASVASTAITYSQKASDLRLQQDVEGIGLRYANIRAGGSVAAFSGSRMRKQ